MFLGLLDYMASNNKKLNYLRVAAVGGAACPPKVLEKFDRCASPRLKCNFYCTYLLLYHILMQCNEALNSHCTLQRRLQLHSCHKLCVFPSLFVPSACHLSALFFRDMRNSVHNTLFSSRSLVDVQEARLTMKQNMQSMRLVE